MDSTTAQDIIRCHLCTGEEKLLATMVCKPCMVKLCTNCLGNHFASDPSEKHDVSFYVASKQVENISDSPYEEINLPLCKTHLQQECEMSCQECNIPVCSKCLIDVHKKHDVIDITEVCVFQNDKMMKDSEEIEKNILPEYEEIDKAYEYRLSKLPGNYDEFKKSVKIQGDELHKIIDRIIKKYLQKAEETEKEDEELLRKLKSENAKIISSLNKLLKKIKGTLESTDVKETVLYSSELQEYRNIPPQTELNHSTFLPRNIPVEEVDTMFGEIKSSTKTTIQGRTIPVRISSTCNPVKQVLGKPESDISTNTGFDVLTGVCCTTRNHLIYARGKEGTIKLFNTNSNKLQTEVSTKTGNAPNSMAVAANGKLIYTDLDDRSINKVHIRGKQVVETLIRLQGWKPTAICCTTSGDLLVAMTADDVDKQSKIIRYDGPNVTQEIQFDKAGKPLFSNPQCIAENKNLDICLTNSEPEEVIVVNKKGKFRFKYEGVGRGKKHEFSPKGIATDSQCHILIGDFYNKCVHIISKDGNFIRDITNCNLLGPWDLCISQDDMLYVAEFNSRKVRRIRYLQ